MKNAARFHFVTICNFLLCPLRFIVHLIFDKQSKVYERFIRLYNSCFYFRLCFWTSDFYFLPTLFIYKSPFSSGSISFAYQLSFLTFSFAFKYRRSHV